MPYLVIEDFALGMDLRRSPVMASSKSARLIRNGFINAGGEIEKRKTFYLETNTLHNTIGLATLNLAPWVFGAVARAALPGLVSWMNYQQLTGGSGLWVRVSDVDVFDNKLYVVVENTAGNYEHYYDGALVSDAPNSPIAISHRSKMWGAVFNVLYFCTLNDPTKWTPVTGGTGGGYIQLDGQDEGAIYITGLSTYYNQLAVFGRNAVQLWQMDEDPAQNQMISSLGATGLVAPQGLHRFSTGDVLFMNDSGVRSLKARDASNAAVVSDVGSPMDEELRELIHAAQRADQASLVPNGLKSTRAVIDPGTGQFWLSVGDKIYVLSIVPSNNISAWSRFDTGFPVTDMTTVGPVVWLRSGDNAYSYGHGPYDYYDNSQLEVILPMTAANEPATDKMFTGLDAAIDGTWQFEVATDVANPDTRETVATFNGASFGMQNIGLQNFGTHIGIRATCSDAAKARLASIIVHYAKGATG